MLLAEGLKPARNNAAALRLIAACTVIFGHAYSLVPNPGKLDPIRQWLGFDYSGSLAVKFFFFISGLLIANSWIRNRSVIHFILARFFRIMPALFVSKLICLFLLGPSLTSLTLSAYFGNSWMYEHLWRHPLMDYSIPGVFEKNPLQAANGSLWTIEYEVAMYALLLSSALLGLLRNRIVANAILLIVISVSAASTILVDAIGLPGEGHLLPGFFAFGMLLAVNQEHIILDGRFILVGLILCVACYHGTGFKYAFWLTFIMSTLWLMTTSLVRRLYLPGDFSYGVYVLGWPIQQSLVQLFPELTVGQNILASLCIAIPLGAASWNFVEKPSMDFGKRLSEACLNVLTLRPGHGREKGMQAEIGKMSLDTPVP